MARIRVLEDRLAKSQALGELHMVQALLTKQESREREAVLIMAMETVADTNWKLAQAKDWTLAKTILRCAITAVENFKSTLAESSL